MTEPIDNDDPRVKALVAQIHQGSDFRDSSFARSPVDRQGGAASAQDWPAALM
jgi:hypothetical protein